MIPLLQLRDAAKSFGAVRALKGVSFDLLPGEVHALVGENGAGKSTLVRLLTGAHAADSGLIEINGSPVPHLTPASARRLGIACVYQQPALFPDLSVAENIRLRLSQPNPWRHVDGRAARADCLKLLQRIGAPIAPEQEVRGLSMPAQQLVEIACAVGSGARIVIMDEPTASLTRGEQELLFRIVHDLRSSGAGILYISHRLEEIFALADRVTVLRDGSSLGTRPIDDLDETRLIHLMVGREMSEIYPARDGAPGSLLLALRDLASPKTGVHGVNLDVAAGEIVGLAGLVGSGRTELARLLFGLDQPESGAMLLSGKALSLDSPGDAIAHGIACLPEDRRRHGVIGQMTVAENISLACQSRLFPGGWLRRKIEEQLADKFITSLGIKTAGPRAPVASLSGGNQQKVALARWLATEPRLLVLDEPTQGVDIGAKAEIHRIIRALANQGLGVLLISSDLPEVLGMSDRIAVMRAGKIVKEFPGDAHPHQVMAAAFGQDRRKGS